MAEEQRCFAANPDVENNGLWLASDTEAFSGHVAKARELARRAVDSAGRADQKEVSAILWENDALREAAFGNRQEARAAADAGLKLDPGSQSAAVEAALAYAMIGGAARAQSLAQDLNKRYPADTQLQSVWLTAIEAQVALQRHSSPAALHTLE